jgi:succinate dehydrogenase / fumarate reductase flavoprotein subunit
MDPEWRKVNIICRTDRDGRVTVQKQDLPEIPVELLGLFDVKELGKYLTEPELSRLSEGAK